MVYISVIITHITNYNLSHMPERQIHIGMVALKTIGNSKSQFDRTLNLKSVENDFLPEIFSKIAK